MKVVLPENHILYSSVNDVKQIIQPLENILPITSFAYVKINPDLSRVHLGTDPEWNKFFYENAWRYYQSGGLTEGYHWQSGFAVMEMLDDDECIIDAKQFGISNGVVITNNYQHHTEMAFFAFNPAKNNMT